MPGIRRKQPGFTYIGLLIFLAILGLASAVTLSVGSLVQRRDSEAELIFIGGQYAAAFRSFFDATPAGQRPFPSKLEELLRDPRYPGIRRHLRKIYIDPITGKEEWGLVAAPGGGVMGVHSLSQQAPIKVAGFDAMFAPLSNKDKYSEWVFGIVAPGIIAPAGTVTVPGAKQAAPAAAAARTPGTPVVPSPSAGDAPPPALPRVAATSPAGDQTRTPERPVPDPPKPITLELSAPAEAMLNDVVTVQVGVPAGTAARSVQITLNFDPQTLQFRNIREDSGEEKPGTPRATAGRASVSLQNSEDGRALGPATMQFRVISERKPSTEIAVNGTLLDAAGNRLSVLPVLPHTITLVR